MNRPHTLFIVLATLSAVVLVLTARGRPADDVESNTPVQALDPDTGVKSITPKPELAGMQRGEVPPSGGNPQTDSAASAEKKGQKARPRTIREAGKLLAKSPTEIITEMAFPGWERLLGDEQLRSRAFVIVEEAKNEWRALFASHGECAAKITFRLSDEGKGSARPPKDAGRVGESTVGNQKVYYSERDYPELWVIVDALTDVPTQMETKLKGLVK